MFCVGHGRQIDDAVVGLPRLRLFDFEDVIRAEELPEELPFGRSDLEPDDPIVVPDRHALGLESDRLVGPSRLDDTPDERSFPIFGGIGRHWDHSWGRTHEPFGAFRQLF